MVGEGYSSVKTVSNTLLYVCLAFIMINVGREFEMDKSCWRSYTEDYFIAMATAAFPCTFLYTQEDFNPAAANIVNNIPAEVGAANRLNKRFSFQASPLFQ